MITALEALERLREGNRRFVSEIRGHGTLTGQTRRRELAAGQEPFAIILGCSDSRVPAEIVFDQGLGDLLSVLPETLWLPLKSAASSSPPNGSAHDSSWFWDTRTVELSWPRWKNWGVLPKTNQKTSVRLSIASGHRWRLCSRQN